MAPILAAAFAAASALSKAYNLVHDNWHLVEPVVLMVEKAAENAPIPGVQKAAIAIEALQGQIPEFANMTPELQTAFNTAVKIVKRTQAAIAAVQKAIAPAPAAT